ncbi:MAG: nicotinamide-nucleotide amidase [Gammaproteobacteria bacterium]
MSIDKDQSFSDEVLSRKAAQVGEALLERDWMLATAESCTGGWIAKLVTDHAGSSQWFDRGFVTYSNAAKNELLEVCEATLEEHGAVSEETVRAMVRGALARSNAEVAVAVSGIAGPDGGTPEKPVGTVWFAWSVHTESVVVRCDSYQGDRDSVRRQAVYHALDTLLELLVAGE